MVNLEQSLGLKVKITTILDQAITGTVYSYSPQSQLIVLSVASEKVNSSNATKDSSSNTSIKHNSNINNSSSSNQSSTTCNYKIIKTTFIKSLSLTNPKSIKNKKNLSSFNKFQPSINRIEPSQIEFALKESVNKYLVEKETINKSASYMGQEIFNKLYKTLPQVRWDGKAIIILNELKVDDPYNVKDITLLDESSRAVDLVKKIIDGFWVEFENEKKGG